MVNMVKLPTIIVCGLMALGAKAWGHNNYFLPGDDSVRYFEVEAGDETEYILEKNGVRKKVE